ncbi:FHA domain-containing protein [Microbacterium sp. C7(2022)]|uniref:FHA domain-containing protein n=1 Tax=Microbacterium sp. C7(2022) TaxID=2992759 RepID=UPI00237B7BE6|nr:FHA domain-containing protein [Microbacterium sp. C7(2022)]MDE0545147.1 FHA domain-containing protein [Microbacterium sp. C7(2022)]
MTTLSPYAPSDAGDDSAAAPVLALTWDDGTRTAVYDRMLCGRNPAWEDGAVVVTLRDETLSLSRTHCEIGRDAGGTWITDRHSSNGTVRVRGGERMPLIAGLAYSLHVGDRIELGDRSAVVGGAA